MAVLMAGDVLPLQVIYGGKTDISVRATLVSISQNGIEFHQCVNSATKSSNNT